MVYAHAIRFAIEHGYRTFDFTQGSEAYKFSFGAVARVSPSIAIARKGLRAASIRMARRLRQALPSFNAATRPSGG